MILRVVAACLFALVLAGPARADKIVATYSNPGIVDVNFGTTGAAAICAGATICYHGEESFSSWTSSTTSPYSSNFTTNSNFTGNYTISATYAGGFAPTLTNQYGGVSTTGYYPEQFGTASTPYYTISLTHGSGIPGVNYFGIWISAMDAQNVLNFYRGGINGTLLYSFTTAQLLANIGGITAYFGNPNSGTYHGQDSAEPFAYVNFFDTNGFFDTVQVLEANGSSAGFESSNDAVAYVNPITVVGNQIPEPPAFGLMALALAAFAWARRRRAGGAALG